MTDQTHGTPESIAAAQAAVKWAHDHGTSGDRVSASNVLQREIAAAKADQHVDSATQSDGDPSSARTSSGRVREMTPAVECRAIAQQTPRMPASDHRPPSSEILTVIADPGDSRLYGSPETWIDAHYAFCNRYADGTADRWFYVGDRFSELAAIFGSLPEYAGEYVERDPVQTVGDRLELQTLEREWREANQSALNSETYVDYLARAEADERSGKRKQAPLTEAIWQAIKERGRRPAQAIDDERTKVITQAYEIDADAMSEDVFGPGKFSGASDPQLALAMSVINLNGMADEAEGSTGYMGYAWRVGKFVAVEDTQGFVTVEAYKASAIANNPLANFALAETERLRVEREPTHVDTAIAVHLKEQIAKDITRMFDGAVTDGQIIAHITAGMPVGDTDVTAQYVESMLSKARARCVEYLNRDDRDARVPCSRYDKTCGECAPVAFAVASIMVRESLETAAKPLAETLEYTMGLVVNDHDDVLALIMEHGTKIERGEIDGDVRDAYVAEQVDHDDGMCDDDEPAGVHWPADPDGVDPPEGWTWVERCDASDLYADDELAAFALRDSLESRPGELAYEIAWFDRKTLKRLDDYEPGASCAINYVRSSDGPTLS